MAVVFAETTRKADINFSTGPAAVQIIAAPGVGKRIRIDHINFCPAAATNIQLLDNITNYGGPYPLLASELVFIENVIQDEHGLIELSDNSPFQMSSSIATQVSGFVKYRIMNE